MIRFLIDEDMPRSTAKATFANLQENPFAVFMIMEPGETASIRFLRKKNR